MNKEELIKEFDERQKALRDEFIAKLEDDKKEFKLTYPEDGASVYFIHRGDKSVTNSYFWSNSTTDKNIFELGEYFNTGEEAEQCLRERKLLFKLRQWAKEKNDGWEPDWNNNKQYKFSVDYSRISDKLWSTDSTVYNSFSKIPYFKSEEIGKECIDMFGDEIKEVLC